MAGWAPTIHFEGVEEGASSRAGGGPPPVLRRDVYEAVAMRPSGEPASFAVAPARSDLRGQVVGRTGFAVVETPSEGDGHGELLLVRTGESLRVVLPDRDRSGGGRTTFEVPVSPGPVGDRGLLGAVGLWALQKVVFPLVDPVLGRISDGLVRDWESRRRPHRVRFYAPDDYRTAGTRLAEPRDLRSGRVLLLVHGTNSSSESGSGLGALPPPLVGALHDEYERQVVAFDHPTLATDPVENARWLAGWLREVTADVELDVLCHSRGGLVARLLLERPDLVGLREPPVRFRSLTCVATPHQGTPLADRAHLGRFVDRLLTFAAPLPDNPVTVALEGALTLARQLAVGFLGGLDGVTCMRPAGSADAGAAPLLDSLDGGRRRPSDVRYRAVVGDFEPTPGSGWWHTLKDAGVDVVFGGLPNDAVVPSLSALSLGPEPGSGFDDVVMFDDVDGIMHSRYFAADLMQPILRAWLRREPAPLPVASRRRQRTQDDVRSIANLGPEWSLAEALDLACLAPASVRPKLQQLVARVGGKLWSYATGRGDAPDSPLVVLVPGIMGTELVVGGERVWLSPWRLAHGGFADLQLPPRDPDRIAVPGEVLCAGYRSIVERLAEQFHVVTFPYDWRDDVERAAGRLRTLLETLLDDAETEGVPVHVVAHSMGGLVARLALTEPLHATFHARGGRVVLLGTPNHGSITTPLALVGRHPVLRWLSRVDVHRSLADWVAVAWTFRGLLQLLPSPTLPGLPGGDEPVEWLYDLSRWPGRDDVAAREALQAARALHAGLHATAGDDLHLILGDGVSTPVAIRPIGSDSFEIGMAPAGDGTVATRCGALADARTYLATGVEHGNLMRDVRTVGAVIDILTRGDTKLLPRARNERGSETPAAPAVDWMSPDQAEARLAPGVPATRGARPDAQLWTRRDALVEGLDALAPFLGTSSSPLPALRVRIVHGGLECASHPILVGHATGTPIAGAESRCDELLGDQLSALQLLGLYPDAPGTWRFVPRRRATDRVDGCIVLGLDSSEPLSRGVLGDLVTRAVLDYTDRAGLELATGDGFVPPASTGAMAGAGTAELPVGLSAVAAGSSSAFGLGVERAVMAIVEGVQRANEVLSRAGRPVVETLEIVDRYAGQVERIRWAMERMVARRAAAAGAVQALVLDGEVVERDGRREGMPPAEYESGRWEHLSVDAALVGTHKNDNERHLTYRFARNRAAASETPRRIDRSVVYGVLEDAVRDPVQSVELGRVLYEELLPVEVKDELSRTDNLVLQVDGRTADLPWELLGDRLAGDEPLACRVGLLRQLREPALRVRPSGSMADTALVIGDPPSDLSPLPSARAEATEVAGLLHVSGMNVTTVEFPEDAVGSTATANLVRKAFWSRDHRVVHVAAHGLYRLRSTDGNVQGGVVIGPRTFLTADDFDNLRATPDLVFLNCCHLGRVAPGATPAASGLLDPVSQHRAAASLASALMRIGVKAVVVAGWQVADDTASRFAGEFYRRLLEGVPYGEAVKQARMACFEAAGGRDNTWAAYQCYGDPAFRLWRPADGVARGVGDIATRSLALRALEDLRSRSEEVDDHEPIRGDLAAIETRIVDRWPDDGKLLACLAETWAGVGAYARAIACYESALAAPDGAAPLRAIEQLANLCSQRALQVHRAASGTAAERGAEIEALLEKADRWTATIAGLGPSVERLAIDGSNCKRLAVLRPERRRAYLERAIDAYVRAAGANRKDLYEFRNAIQLAALEGGRWPPALDELLSAGDVVSRWAAAIAGPTSRAGFWERVGRVDDKLTAALVRGDSELGACLMTRLVEGGEVDEPTVARTRALIQADLASQIETLASAYAQVRVGGFPERGWRSVVDHVADLTDLATGADAASAEPLRQLRARLEGIGS